MTKNEKESILGEISCWPEALRADTLFIIKAVNNHEALVEALKEARQAIRAFTIEKETYTNPAVNEKVAIEETLPKIESALLNAEKE